MRESPEAESQQSFCHQQIVELKVSQDLAQLNWSADHLETNTRGKRIQPASSTQKPASFILHMLSSPQSSRLLSGFPLRVATLSPCN